MAWVLVSILVLLVILVVVSFVFSRRVDNIPDYYTLFVAGLSWIPLGIASGNSAFWMLGLVLAIVGLANRNKWKKPKTLKEMGKSERWIRLAISGGLMVLVVLGVVLALLMK
ncbi:MAG: hypothetical protein ABIG95_00075 [Candidatus Woesearchaeota archaeon]